MEPTKEQYIIVAYHYVRDPDPKWTGIHSCSIREFDRQIKLLSEQFKIVSVSEVAEAARQARAGKFCAITFDDGLLDNYQNALPVLEKYGAKATFFIITSVFDGGVPLTHKLHALFSQASAGELIDIFNQWAAGRYSIPKDKRLDQRRVHGDILTNNFKETMVMLDEDTRKNFLDFCFQKFRINEPLLNKQLFMTREQVVDMKRRGMIIGSHSHSHHSFESLKAPEAEDDVFRSNESLTKLLGRTPDVFCYPHGRHSKVTPVILQQAGFSYAVVIERRAVSKNDDSFLLPRYDANDLRA
ncbi:MAG: polysaccharide deacetylase family protein [bacterium]|nr:polysaccharide deacetylase family protein [bacterium]